MSDIVCYDSDGKILDHYTQWDVNRKLIVRGADSSSAPQFHFSNRFLENSVVTTSDVSANGIISTVPDILLQYDSTIIVDLYYTNNGISRTKYSIRIPVVPRKKPENYIYNDNHICDTSSGASIIISDITPEEKSVLWFDTGVVE